MVESSESSEAVNGVGLLEAGLQAAQKSPEQWRIIIQACQSSGTSVRTFCAQHGISQSKFYYWGKRLGMNRSARLRQPTPARFALVKTVHQPQSPVSLPPGDAGLELRLPSRRVVLVRPGFDRQTLAELVQTLEALP
jgi:hypothetical protein